MRLLKCPAADGGFELTSFSDDLVPPYAILSHTWTEGQEVTYDDLLKGTGIDKNGYSKIRFCSQRAAADGLEYFWVDTCCINKATSDELSTAINSMFRWYQRAAKCYVLLTDVSGSEEATNIEAFRRSRWFTRGWTLQEMLAPASVEFFSNDGRRLGDRTSLEQEIHTITGIPVEALRGQKLTEFSVEERMTWADKRTTTLKEDKVYCLLGIFEVFLPLIYGEGEDYAAMRLKEEIQRRQQRNRNTDLQDLPVSSSLPFPRNELFVGRESQLRSIEKNLTSPNTHQRLTIYGLGGCGKSALALEFAYRVLAESIGHLVFWVPAMSRESFELAYRDIGTRLHIPGINNDNANVKRLVKDTISSGNLGSWLMIVDNADNSEVLLGMANDSDTSARLIDYIPHSKEGSVLFTTRSRKAATDLTQDRTLELEDMSNVEARRLFARRITKQALLNDEAAVDALIESLTGLPLAIVQAAAFINQNEISVSEYASLLEHAGNKAELFNEHFEDPSRYRDMDSTVAKTWHISFEQIQRQDPLAADYLSFIGCIDRIGIPLSLLPPGESVVQQTKAIGTLTGYAFVTERQQTSSGSITERLFDMHRLVHMALTWWLEGHGERRKWADIAAARIEKLVPHGGHERKEVWTAYLSHALYVTGLADLVDGATRASLLDRIGQCHQSLGQYGAAETACRNASSLRTEILGPEDMSTLVSMSSLSWALKSQGKYKEAEKINRQTMVQYQKVLGPDHPFTLISMSNLALVLDSQDKYDEAKAITQETLKRREKLLGPKHPETLTSMSILAGMLNSQSQYKAAEALNRETLARREEVLGPRHPDTLTSMSNLAGVLSNLKKYEEAKAIYQETLARREQVLGPTHPDTLTSIYGLAYLLAKQSHVEEALRLYQKVLAGYNATLGKDHPITLACHEHYTDLCATHKPKPANSSSPGASTMARSRLSRGLVKMGIRSSKP